MEPQLDRAQVNRAVLALKQFIKKKQSLNAKHALVEDVTMISAIYTRKTIPSISSLKAIPM
jgi:hypothetical protein